MVKLEFDICDSLLYKNIVPYDVYIIFSQLYAVPSIRKNHWDPWQRHPWTMVYEEHGILLYQRDRTMVAYGKIHFEA